MDFSQFSSKYSHWLSPPQLTGTELTYLNAALDSGWLAPVGPQLEAFENRLRSRFDLSTFWALHSGTLALTVALAAAGVQPGDEVIVPDLTYVATALPVLHMGATPVLVDCSQDSFHLDAELLSLAIEDRYRLTGKRPKAIIVVHLFGFVAHLEPIQSLAKHYEICLIEDAAQALGASMKGIYAGSMADMGIYSFNSNKIITTSSGGGLTVQHSMYAQKTHQLIEGSTRSADLPIYTHRLSNLLAAVGLAQLEALDSRIACKTQVYQAYRLELEGWGGLSFPAASPGMIPNYWITTALLSIPDSRKQEELASIFSQEGIEFRKWYTPLSQQPLFRSCPGYLKGYSQIWSGRGLFLPSGLQMTPSEQAQVIDLLKWNL